MKKSCLFFKIIPLFCLYSVLLSCEEGNSESEPLGKPVTTQTLAKATTGASNRDNPYDDAGRIHNELMDAYHHNGYYPEEISGIARTIDSLAQRNSDFLALTGDYYQPADTQRIRYLFENRANCLSELIAESGLSAAGMRQLEPFVASFLLHAQTTEDYEAIYEEVVIFEAAVLADATLSPADQEFILTVTSIVRHSAKAAKKKPKKASDPIWDMLVLNIYGAIDGADQGMASSIMMGLCCGIADQRE